MSEEFSAFYHAQEAHEYQKYGEDEYMLHLEDVTDMVCKLCHDYKWGGFCWRDAIDVAWLHDCLEDQPEYYNSIPNVPSHIHEAIVSISKQDKETRSEYLERCCENRLSHFVKICDTMCNLKCSVESIESRRVNKYTKQLAKLIGLWEEKYVKQPNNLDQDRIYQSRQDKLKEWDNQCAWRGVFVVVGIVSVCLFLL